MSKSKKEKSKKVKFTPDVDLATQIKERISAVLKEASKKPEPTTLSSYMDLVNSRGPTKDGMVVIGPHGKISFAIPLGATVEQKEIFRILMDALRKSTDADALLTPDESNIDFDEFDSFVEASKKKKEDKPQ
jgi:hypothetical protein